MLLYPKEYPRRKKKEASSSPPPPQFYDINDSISLAM
jgi:hypothetical protein